MTLHHLIGAYKLAKGVSTGLYILGYKRGLRKEHNTLLKKELKHAWDIHKK